MGSLKHYEFQSAWTVEAPPEDVYDVLYEVAAYPRWWPEVKEATKLDEDRYLLRCRSFLPYVLSFVTARQREDRVAGILEARMEGDLEGFSRWTITAAGEGSRLVFDEVVITNKKVLNALAPIARPAFRFNHTLMMRHGRKGLATFLAGYRLARAAERVEPRA